MRPRSSSSSSSSNEGNKAGSSSNNSAVKQRSQKRPSCCCKEIESKHERLMVVRDLQGVSVNKKAEHLIASPRRRNQNGVRWFCFKPTFFFVLSFDTFRFCMFYVNMIHFSVVCNTCVTRKFKEKLYS
ncbi:unnamed protein product [Brassica napus]|uniref:(rape) hypothetical protein n=1 Tax=Brassica napus TaxID=3708 RepID=A0A816KFY3_BRANA|nr:unnamed protein product [Brassica napus]